MSKLSMIIKQLGRDARDRTLPVNLALSHFDHFYASVFGKEWPSIRISLLSKKTLCAVVTQQHGFQRETALNLGTMDLRDIFHHIPITGVQPEIDKLSHNPLDNLPKEESEDTWVSPDDLNAFMPPTEMIYKEEIITEQEYFEFYQPKDETQINIVPCPPINYPSNWNVFMLPQGDPLPYPPLPMEISYLLVDPASLLPPLVLDLKPGDRVLDLCCGTGIGTLGALLTAQPSMIVANDKQMLRVKEMHRLFDNHNLLHLSDFQISKRNAERHDWGAFDKVLVDVPSTNDRYSLNNNKDNIFQTRYLKLRRDIPIQQKNMLLKGLTCLSPGGTLVYSTGTLSPVQNDGVVYMALQELQDSQPHKEFEIHNLESVLQPFSGLAFRFSQVSRLGQLVVPSLPHNYGPLYISRISRIK